MTVTNIILYLGSARQSMVQDGWETEETETVDHDHEQGEGEGGDNGTSSIVIADDRPTNAKKRKRKIHYCGILSRNNFLVRYAKMLIDWPPFEAFILLVIAANCIVMAMEEHHPPEQSMVS